MLEDQYDPGASMHDAYWWMDICSYDDRRFLTGDRRLKTFVGNAFVQESWGHVLPATDAAWDQFYRRRLELDPDLERHFSGADMDCQKSRLASAIDFVVSHLDQSEALKRQLQEPGARHAGYAVCS